MGAIHGRLLIVWSTAGIVGPVVVNDVREAQIASGVPRAQVYDYTMYILAGMLVVGFVRNLLIRPVNPKWHMSDEEVATLQARSKAAAARGDALGSAGIGRGGLDAKAAADSGGDVPVRRAR